MYNYMNIMPLQYKKKKFNIHCTNVKALDGSYRLHEELENIVLYNGSKQERFSGSLFRASW